MLLGFYLQQALSGYAKKGMVDVERATCTAPPGMWYSERSGHK